MAQLAAQDRIDDCCTLKQLVPQHAVEQGQSNLLHAAMPEVQRDAVRQRQDDARQRRCIYALLRATAKPKLSSGYQLIRRTVPGNRLNG
jgi:hypothetical protein